ncbi:hypothetical protein ACX0G7_09640 [Flavitalea antarctica]
MKTSFEFVDLVWTRLNASTALKTSINGGIYKYKRPDGSLKQDIVINSLVVSNEQLQRGVLNVNFHCPNLKINVVGQPSISSPDSVKLKAVSNLIIPLLEDYASNDFSCHVGQQSNFEEPGTQEYISNIRINIFSFNP